MTTVRLKQLILDLKKAKNLERGKFLQRFFKTGPGQYGEGDVFWGLSVPEQRAIAKNYHDLSLSDIQVLLNNEVHEFRLVGLLILVSKYRRADDSFKKGIFNFYIANAKKVNNWDLVDLSAAEIVGDYLLNQGLKGFLITLAKSENIWEKRIAVVSSYEFIKNRKFDETFKIVAMLVGDKHDLIHKACGWMLREVGKKDENALLKFLDKYYLKLPRTTLRYSIERLDSIKKKFYMAKV